MARANAAQVDIYEIAARLWETADELRANSHLKAAEYSIPVLGLIFLKFADSRFTTLEGELKGKSTGRREIGKTDYQARGVLYLPDAARFNQLLLLKESDNLQRRYGRHRGAEPAIAGRLAANVPGADQQHALQPAAIRQRQPAQHSGRRVWQGVRVLPRQIRHRRGRQGRRILHPDVDGPADRRGHRPLP